jgi:nicotinic acid mononucleotide adenylyltransferase
MNNKDDSKKRYTKESNNDIWENWKRNIDLVKFVCERYGYEIVKKDGYCNNSNNNLLELNDGKYHVALKKFEFNGVRNETVDTILVRRNINQQYLYTNPNNRNDQGNIAQLVANNSNQKGIF